MAAVTICSDFGAQKNKVWHCFHCFPKGMMLKLKLHYFGHLMRRVDSLEKTPMLGGIGGRRKGRQQRMRWLDGIWTPGVGDGQGGLACCNSWGCKESDTTERLNWTELNWLISLLVIIVQIIWWYTLGWIYFKQLAHSWKVHPIPGRLLWIFSLMVLPSIFVFFISALSFWSFSYFGYPISWTSLPIIFSLLFPPCFPEDFLNWIFQYFYQVFHFCDIFNF